MNSIRIESCEFLRRPNSGEWEHGVIINEGSGPIIDMSGKVVPSPIQDWRPRGDHVMTVFDIR